MFAGARLPGRMTALACVAAVCAVVAVLWLPEPAAGEHGVYDVEVSEVVEGEGDELLAIVTVLDHDRPVPGLAAAQFSATEDGTAIPIASVDSSETASIPLSVVITLDTSGSMEGAPMTASVDAAEEFIGSLAAGDPAALVSFADAASVRQNFTADRAALVAALSSLAAGGNTALYDAVAQSAQIAANASTARKAVLLLSDGEDFGGVSSQSRGGSLQAAEDSGAIFYVVGLGDSIDTGYLGELVTRTGGTYFPAPSPGDIAEIYRTLSQRLRGQYVVRLQSSTAGEGGEHELTIAVNATAGAGEGTASFTRVAPPTRVPTPTQTPSATQSPAPATETPSPTVEVAGTGGEDGDDGGGGGGVGVPLIATGIVGALVVAGGGLLLSRRRAAGATDANRPTGAAPPKRTEPEIDDTPYAELQIVEPGGAERAFSVGVRPLTVGSDAEADIVLDRAAGVGREHIRLWWRDGRLMLHHLDRVRKTMVNGEPAEWLALEPGDEIVLGDCQIRYVEAAAPPEEAKPVAGLRPQRGKGSP